MSKQASDLPWRVSGEAPKMWLNPIGKIRQAKGDTQNGGSKCET